MCFIILCFYIQIISNRRWGKEFRCELNDRRQLTFSLFVWLCLVVNNRKFLAGTVFFSRTNQPAVLLHESATKRTSQPNGLLDWSAFIVFCISLLCTLIWSCFSLRLHSFNPSYLILPSPFVVSFSSPPSHVCVVLLWKSNMWGPLIFNYFFVDDVNLSSFHYLSVDSLIVTCYFFSLPMIFFLFFRIFLLALIVKLPVWCIILIFYSNFNVSIYHWIKIWMIKTTKIFKISSHSKKKYKIWCSLQV